jgi:hypothetical protein
MKRMMKKILKLPLIAWLLIAFGAGIVIGAVLYTLVIPGTVTILPPEEGTYEIKVYSDANCTQEIAFIDFGSVHAGDSIDLKFYLKNTGNVKIPIIDFDLEISDVQITSGTLTTDLEAGQVRNISRSIQVRPEAGAGTYSVELRLECCA